MPWWKSFLTSTGSALTQRTLWMSEITPIKAPVLKAYALKIFGREFGVISFLSSKKEPVRYWVSEERYYLEAKSWLEFYRLTHQSHVVTAMLFGL
jgi:hypothetical protein